VYKAKTVQKRLFLYVKDRAVSVGLVNSGRWWVITQPLDSLKGLNVDGTFYGPFENAIPPIFTYDDSSCVSGYRRLGHRNSSQMVSSKSAEYPAGCETSPISLSHNRVIMVYSGADGDNFVTPNGRRHIL